MGERESSNQEAPELEIAYAAIFPPIGIARVGDSTSDYFIGPELSPTLEAPATYKDALGRIKRQAARFRVYGFDANGRIVKEITGADAEIHWSVHLANKKAAWFAFDGAERARRAFANDESAAHFRRRNGNHEGKFGQIIKNPETGRYESDKKRRALEIDGGRRTISGIGVVPSPGPAGDKYRFKGIFKAGVDGYAGAPVYLGEILTDARGRLVVLGGRGVAEPVGPEGPITGFGRIGSWITNYANNDDWHDDTSDGPVNAEVTLKGGRKIKVSGAWVLVTPPDFAPQVTNLVTLYDVMEEVAIAARLTEGPGCPPLRPATIVDFETDIHPLFQRINDYRWVSPLGSRGHGYGKPGAFDEEANKSTNEKGDVGLSSRDRFMSILRTPTYRGLDPETGRETHTKDNDAGAISQANNYYMPPLSGDEGDRTAGKPSTWLTLTRLQYRRFQVWHGAGAGDGVAAKERNDSEPARLTQSALGACAGGAFFPGIEMTAIARDPSLYCEPFRFDQARVDAGDITKFMACPWQADFYECRDDWWPAQRPDTVITEEAFDEAFADFELDRTDGIEQVLFPRERWDRALDRSPWPDRAYVRGQMLPEPRDADASAYAKSIADSATDVLFSLSPASTLDDLLRATLEPGQQAERLPNPWRLQYLTQEQLDGYSGRYFLPAVPSPETALSASPGKATGGPRDPVQDLKNGDAGLEHVQSLADLRRLWPALRLTHSAYVGRVAGAYAKAMRSSLRKYIFEVVSRCPLIAEDAIEDATDVPRLSPAQTLMKSLARASSDPRAHPEDFREESPHFLELRAGEFVKQISSLIFIQACAQQGDMAMVNEWRHLGFVRKMQTADVQVETERSRFDGKSYRDYFYYLMNIERYPEFLDYSKQLVRSILASAQALIEMKARYDSSHPESFVPYSTDAFAAKLEQIYEILRSQADQPQQFVYDFVRSDSIAGITRNAPFNQIDGAWLRHAANAGPMSSVTELLFDVWSDEAGNGDPSLNHSNLYTDLLRSLGLYLPDVASREYADDARFSELGFVSPVFELAISQHSEEFYPEILGMTLYLEWEVLSLAPGVRSLDYFGIDSQFWRMHIGIDNASEGHGAKAREAVELYLDRVLSESGPDAQQLHWKRVWQGFVAFATAGYDMFQSFEKGGVVSPLTLDAELRRHPKTAADRVAETMRRKSHYGSLNHLQKQLGVYRINDLFDDPGIFIEELAHSQWVVAGNPAASRLISYLTTFKGPMYKVFGGDDLAAWRNWIEWLGREGDTLRPKQPIDRSEAMLLLVSEMRSQMMGADGHKLYRIQIPGSKSRDTERLSDLFRSSSAADIMRALANSSNGWVVKHRPTESALVVDLLRPGRRMGEHLDRRFPQLLDQVGRMIIYEWIAAGTPIPGEPKPDAANVIITKRRPRVLLMQQYGMGAVH